ncbi:MAG: addiction module protein [Proteobacteria bacterium]|nr:MAG: addiction module protein [Pseudomonadota bacterium]
MRAHDIKHEVEQLALSEKLLLIEDIWDSIASSNDILPMPEWQKSELDKRYIEYKNSNMELQGWQSVHEGIRDC